MLNRDHVKARKQLMRQPQPEVFTTVDSSSVDAIAEETHTSPEIVKTLYDEEVAALQAQARITAFIAVIARQKVKRRLKQGTQ